MPSTSPKQHRFMEAVAHSPGFARSAGVPQSVGRDFARADAARGIAKPAAPPREREPRRTRMPARGEREPAPKLPTQSSVARPLPDAQQEEQGGAPIGSPAAPSQGHAAAASLTKPRKAKLKPSGNPF